MDRRSFFRTMVGGVAAAAAVRTFPFRVYSFPTDIYIPGPYDHLTFDEITATTLAELRGGVLMDSFFVDTPWLSKLKKHSSEFLQAGPMQTPFQYP